VTTAAVAVLALGLTASPALAAGTAAQPANWKGGAQSAGYASETSADERGRVGRKCRDMKCKVTIHQGQSFRLNGRYGYTRISFPDIGRGGASIEVTGPGVASSCAGSVPLRCRFNGVLVKIKNVHGHQATLRMRP
jgi:hypothetical protein